MKKCFSLAILLAIINLVQAQTIVPISSEEEFTITSCNELIVTAEAYADESFHSIFIHKDPSIEGPITAIVNPSYFETIWDVDELAEVRIYGVVNMLSITLGVFNQSNFAEGFMLDIEYDSFIIDFESNTGSAGDGFEMQLLCQSALAELPTIKFTPTYQEGWVYDEDMQMDVFNTCANTSNTFSLTPSFLDLNPENQSVETVNFKWAMGDHIVYRGLGLIEVEHTYTIGQGFQVTAYTIDTAGTESYTKFLVINMPAPAFSLLDSDQAYCENQAAEVTGGMIADVVAGATPAAATGISITEFFGTEIFLPDGNNTNYTTEIEVSGFPDGTELADGAGLTNLCINMEHSYLGDLEMMLTCPDGTSINVFNSFTGDGLFPGGFGGGGTYLGDANDDNSGNPGIGFYYCFNDNTEFGLLGDELASGNTVPVNTFDFGGNAMTPGSYQPEESLSTFEGCPANGIWTLTVRDNLGVDNGWIFDWSLGFDMELNPGIVETSLVDGTWQDHEWISSVNEGAITVTPTSGGTEILVFEVTDNAGCTFQEAVEIESTGIPADINETGVCDLTYEFPWYAYTGEISVSDGPSNEVEFEEVAGMFKATVGEAGTYTFGFSDTNCGFSATAELEFLPFNHPDCVTGTNNLSVNKSLKLVPNPSEANTAMVLEIEFDELLEISIFSLEGRLISQEKIRYVSGKRALLKTESMDAGTYLISVLGETFQAATLFVKQ